MPPAKKRRIDAAAVSAAEIQEKDDGSPLKHHLNTNNSILTTKLIEQHHETLKTLRSNISDLAASASSGDTVNRNELILSSSLALSNLKSLQRQISLQVEAHATSSRVQRENVEECSLVLENLNYERNYLRGEIALMQEWDASELEKMAWKELGLDPTTTTAEKARVGEGDGKDDDDKMEVDDSNKITTAEEAIDTYLLGGDDSNNTDIKSKSSHRDPSNHAYILQKLQSNLQTRSTLVEQLSKSKLELKELQKKRDTYRNFLNQIPKKLVELEKAGESLNTFFGGGNSGGGVWKDVLNDTTNADEDEVMDDGSKVDVAAASRKKKVQAANLLVNRPSCDRTKRFQLAQSNLPSPLYVLFVQLVGYLDAWASLELLGTGDSEACIGEDSKILDGFVGANGMDVAAVPPDEGSVHDSWNVVLSLSPSDILPPEIGSILGKSYANSRSTTSVIKVIFSYNKEQGVVFASVNDEEGNEGLLDGLFPGDDGVTNPNESLSLLKRDEDEFDDNDSDKGDDIQDGKESNAEDKSIGKPYYWCQVLSGPDFPPPSSSNSMNETAASNGDGGVDAPSFQIQTCTKAVFRQLLRRIRARKTLAAMLEYMSKRSQLHPLPIHPSMKGEDNADGSNPQQSIKAKLQSWVDDSKEGGKDKLVAGTSYKKSYTATIKRKSSTLKATVIIDTQRYPSEPPVWSLQNEDGSSGTVSSWGEEHGSVSSLQQNSNNVSGTPPLFDAALHRIECHVNQDLDKFVRQDVENTYDWILIHQLADIVSSWDEVMSASEGGFGSSSSKGKGGNDNSMGERMFKGKDRRLIAFGERSPFFWYRNGL